MAQKPQRAARPLRFFLRLRDAGVHESQARRGLVGEKNEHE
jgi:hypothetical protein